MAVGCEIDREGQIDLVAIAFAYPAPNLLDLFRMACGIECMDKIGNAADPVMRGQLGQAIDQEALKRICVETFGTAKYPATQPSVRPPWSHHRPIEASAKLVVGSKYGPFTAVRRHVDGGEDGVRIGRPDGATKIRQEPYRTIVGVKQREVACVRHHGSTRLNDEDLAETAHYLRRKKNSKTWSVSLADSN